MRYRKKSVFINAYKTDKEVVIHTSEGDIKASVGDYIITGENGEQYPCKPDIFEKTYERYDPLDNHPRPLSCDDIEEWRGTGYKPHWMKY